MEILKENLRAFDLTDAEMQILLALAEPDVGSISVSALSRRADVPRTTVYSALVRLKDRGFVRRVHKGRRTIWKISSSDKIEHVVTEGLEHLGVEADVYEEEIVGGIDAVEIGITVYRGKRQILKAYEQMLKLSKAERVFAIQGNKSAEIMAKNLDKSYLLDFHNTFKRKQIIMEGFNGEYVFKLLKKLSIDELKSHADRMLIGTILEDPFMDFDLDVLVMRDVILLVNIKTETVVMIKNRPIVDMIHKFCLLFQEYGRQINYNREIWKIIEQKEKK